MESLIQKYENMVRTTSESIHTQLWRGNHFWKDKPECAFQNECERQGLIAPVQAAYDYLNGLLIVVWENELVYSRVGGPFRFYFLVSEKSLLCNSGVTSLFYKFPAICQISKLFLKEKSMLQSFNNLCKKPEVKHWVKIETQVFLDDKWTTTQVYENPEL